MGRRKKFRPVEGQDYVYDDRRHIVWTRDYLLRLGACCGAQCAQCPYGRVSGSSEVLPLVDEAVSTAGAPAAK